MNFIFKFFILYLMFFSAAYANENLNYDIKGNKRISDKTIINIIDLKKNKKYNVDDLNNFQKKLYGTNYFSKVSLKIFNNTIQIVVEENPIIDFFYINGVVNNKREEFFMKIYH